MLKAAIPLNLRIQSTHLSQDVAEKLSGLMPCRFSGDVVGDELLLGVTKTKTLENEDLRPKTRLSFRDYEN